MSKWSKVLTKKILIEEYIQNHKSTRKIAEKYGCTNCTVLDYLNKFNILTRNNGGNNTIRYTHHLYNLSKWTYDTAYILGFLVADGCLYLQQNKHPTLQISLKKDIDNNNFLNYIQKIIESNYPIIYTHVHNQTHKRYHVCKLTICKLSDNDVKFLQQRGIFPRKSCFEFMPKIPKKYKFTWLRGFFDGDGNININKDKRRQNSFRYNLRFFSGGIKILHQIQKLCFNYGYIHYQKNINGHKVYNFNISKKDHLKHIAQLMYKYDNFSLTRKKNQFIKYGILS